MRRTGLLTLILVIGLFVLLYEVLYPWWSKPGPPPLPSLRFDYAEDFSEGLAAVRLNGKSGFIDRTGRMVVPPKFEAVQSFSQGLAAVEVGEKRELPGRQVNGQWGIIDREGKMVIAPRFYWVSEFSEGFATFIEKGPAKSCYGVIDRSGKIVYRCPSKYKLMGKVSEGLITFYEERPAPAGSLPAAGPGMLGPGMYIPPTVNVGGYMTPFGEVVISPQFVMPQIGSTALGDFHEGLACVPIGGLYGYIDRSGKVVIPAQWKVVREFRQGLALVFTGSSSYLIDKTGRTAYSIPRDDLFALGQSYFPDGLICAGVGGKCGFADRNGAMVIPAKFDLAQSFSEGLAAVEVGRSRRHKVDWGRAFRPWTAITGQGTSIVYSYTESGKFGYIDKTGKMVIPPRFDGVGDFHEGFARVEYGGKSHFIDKTGKPLDRGR